MVSYLTVHVKKSEISYASQAYRLVNFINTQPKTTTIYITSFGYSIYYYLYYSKIPPVDIQKYAVWEKPDETGFAHITDYKNLHVVWDGVDKFYCPQKNSNETLYITDTENGDLKPVATINSFDNIYKLLYIYNLSRDRDTVCPIKQKP